MILYNFQLKKCTYTYICTYIYKIFVIIYKYKYKYVKYNTPYFFPSIIFSKIKFRSFINHIYIFESNASIEKKKENFWEKRKKKIKKINRAQRGKSGAINHLNNSRIDERCPLRGQVRLSEKARIESIVNQIEGGTHKSGFRKRKEGGEGRNFIPRFISSTWFRLAFHLPGQLGPRANSLRQFRFPLISRVTTGGSLPSSSPPSPRNCL